MKAKYISAEGKDLGPGEAGELWLSGPNVFKGYWKNDSATKDCMSEDGYFKTGDVGYQDEHHNFYITGKSQSAPKKFHDDKTNGALDRVKELIKYKGFQVAPAELEGKLMDHPDINDVAVIGVQDEEMHTEVPRAYVVPAKGKNSEKDAKAIVEWIAGQVASHKRLRGGVRFIDEGTLCS
jgi:4-coumarate--CoA ligase